ncbi:enoyl-CoA hydratase-related protein [Mesobacillus maritimus]|uniref:enoyl-CoA hydratase/isomerase family protein n=1 Tax=Mesobacillus maritimus TaxID=1643336 RepID=UPI002040289D|nr:enoyl-CoA hydratase-related protein [Mesobacillus maritimus]MCM3584192.1 enoyl-CoA hydratase-related protein [Mesobacillus maritimus]MCM3669346.1 enoyl-CoA hydratase-related protein [Mesobacillus maritimus]
MEQPVLYRKEGHKAYITFNRPEAMNAMTPEGFEMLGDYFLRAQDDDEVRVIILTGAGEKAFCSGADLKQTIPQIMEGKVDPEKTDAAMLKNTPVWKPIISAVNGFCLAGGTEILQATDIRIATEDARFGLPEPKWSIMAAAGSLVRLVRQIPYCRAMEILLTGEQFSAQEAKEMGLINKIVPKENLLEEAERYANIICKNGPIAVQSTKKAVLRLLNHPMDIGFREEWSYSRDAFTSEDAKEGIRAFIEKRSPEFKGQ